MKCCICNKEIEKQPTGWDKGHNAMPVKKGRCCRFCNYSVVLPERLGIMSETNTIQPNQGDVND